MYSVTSHFSYIPLFRTLAKRKLKLTDIHKQTNISETTLAKLKKNEAVSLLVLKKISTYLQCDINSIMTFSSDPYSRIKKFELIIKQPIPDDYEYTIVINTPVGRKILNG